MFCEVSLGEDGAAVGTVNDLNLVRVDGHVQQLANHRNEKVLIHGDFGPLPHQWHYRSVVLSVTATAAEKQS